MPLPQRGVHGETPIIISPTDKESPFPKVTNRLTWLVAWRGVPANSFDPPVASPTNDDPIDFVAFVDAESGELLYKVFGSLD